MRQTGAPGRLVAGLVVAALSAGCGSVEPPPLTAVDPAAHAADVEEWRARRHDQLAEPDGWLSLVALAWLHEGANRVGAAADAEVRLVAPTMPDVLGTLLVEDGQASFEPADGVEVHANGAVFAGGLVRTGIEGEESVLLSWGTLTWHVVSRGGRLAVRAKDSAAPGLVAFDGMRDFPTTLEWRIDGHFESYDPPAILQIPNILGTVSETPSPGVAVFQVDGETYRIDLWRDSDDPENLFTAFADATNNTSTYGGGRFLWIDAPDAYGRVVVDFNKAYNPPCVFTAFATCPLPPPQNRLPLVIEAGERSYKPPVAASR